jgi:hypothetical protein
MTDSELTISVGRAFAVVAYGVAVALIVLMWTTGDKRLGITGLVVSGAGAVALVRSYFVQFGQTVRNAYELGRDSARASVSPLSRR